jgi:hypothetical protein
MKLQDFIEMTGIYSEQVNSQCIRINDTLPRAYNMQAFKLDDYHVSSVCAGSMYLYKNSDSFITTA